MKTLETKLLNKFSITVDYNKEFPFRNKYGLIDNAGRTILKPLFHAVWELNDYLVGYRFGSRFGIINKNGKRVIDPILKGDNCYTKGKKDYFTFAEEFFTKKWNEGEYLSFDIDHTYKTFLIDKMGKIISNGQFATMGEATPEGYCLVANNDKWGLFNLKKKKLVIDTIFPHGHLNSEGHASAIKATTVSLAGKKYRLNEKTRVFELVTSRK